VRRLAVLALLAAACSGRTDETCPGEVVGTFSLAVAIPDGVSTPPFCSLPLPDPPEPRVVQTFDATLTVDRSPVPTRAAALCVGRPLAAPYYGSRDAAGTFTLEATSGIAVVKGPDDVCGPNCSATVTERITGSISDDGSGAVFQGTLEESFEARGGDCGSCVFPCTATYTLTTVR
jgi:hypothetical protein